VKKAKKLIKTFFLILVAVFMLVVPAFHICEDLIECDILSPIPDFEQEHPHEMSADRHDIHQAIGSYVWAITLLGTEFSQQSPHPLFPTISPSQQTPTLRC
jgi:hypothetical protein